MIAHIRQADKAEETVPDHCRKVAVKCSDYAESIHAGSIGKLMGLLHDVGKLTTTFEKYIRQESTARRGDIDHSYAGAKYCCAMAANIEQEKYKKISKLIVHTILSHHGLHDWLAQDDNAWYDYAAKRLDKSDDYTEVLKHIGTVLLDDEMSELLNNAAEEYQVLMGKLKTLARKTGKVSKIQQQSYGFYIGMLERFLQSCLIDADRTKTADFMNATYTEKVYDMSSILQEMFKRMQQKNEAFSENTDAISRQRRSISDRCASFANHHVGACRLIVPTGGGKTLSSLRFAIDYALNHSQKRIFYIAPFMSILEQNSDVWRKIVGEEYFLEHHSNILSELNKREELEEYELRTEIWDMPVIATTLVQFLNALFLGTNGAVRRMHRLSDAVIVIDEVQSIPLKCIYLFNMAVNFLTQVCNTTVVLCSATQPAVDITKFPIILDEDSSMTGNTDNDFKVFQRTKIIPNILPHGYSYEEAAGFCMEKFKQHGNLLLIVNTKQAAKKLFADIKDSLENECLEATVIHLSTNLCPAHRRAKIEQMKELLEKPKEQPLICVTTQLIEAGVDVSFRCVVRSLAGADNFAQAAGRCNRNGESDAPCSVYIIKLREENITCLHHIKSAQQITQQMIDNDKIYDFLSPDVQRMYSRLLYRNEEKNLSYPVDNNGIQTNLVELLSLNRDAFNMSGLPRDMRYNVQAFKTAGRLFKVIEENTQDVIVPYNDEAKKIISELDLKITDEYYKDIFRRAQKYIVSLYDEQLSNFIARGAIHNLNLGAMALEECFYDKNDYGLMTEGLDIYL